MRRFSVVVLALLILALLPRDATGSIDEQRARLPPPADCQDTVEGTWLSVQYLARARQWYETTLYVRRASAGATDLAGDIYVHYWIGGPGDAHTPPCRPGGFETSVKQPNARGSLEGLAVSFGATTYTIDKVQCGTSTGIYYPDHFSGTIDTAINEFQSVNNDGHVEINEPVVFRRVSCATSPTNGAAPPSAAPPAYEPPKRGLRCGK
jgi:hypothetical protein